MAARIASLFLIFIIIVGSGVLVYRFFNKPATSKAKILTIDKNGNFTTSEFKLSNSDTFKIKNEANKNYTVKRGDNNTTLVEVDPNSTSKELTLGNDKTTSLYLAGAENKKVVVTTGTPATETAQKTTTTTTTAPPLVQPPSQKSTSQNTLGTTTKKPLPSTGPEDTYLYLILLVVGLRLGKITSRFLPQ